MNKKNIICSFIIGAFFLLGCQKSTDFLDNNNGSLSLLISTKSETNIPVIMKSASPTVDVDTFHVVIKDASETPIKQNFDTFKELREEGQPLLLPVGTYSIEASSGDLPGAAFGQPCYRDTKTFEIEENTVTEKKLTCTLQSVKVTLKYTAAFLKMINPDFKVTVTNGSHELIFVKTETRSAYFQVSQLFTVHVKGTASEFGTRIDFAGDLKPADSDVSSVFKAADHLIVTLDAYKETPKIKSVQIL